MADLDLPLPTSGLRVRTTGLWADHHCEAPFEQWTVRNECHAVALDDPADALGRAYGTAAAVAFDLEWYAAGGPAALDGGYVQAGEAHAVIEVAGGPLELVGPAARSHTWGAFAVPAGAGFAGRRRWARPLRRLPAGPGHPHRAPGAGHRRLAHRRRRVARHHSVMSAEGVLGPPAWPRAGA